MSSFYKPICFQCNKLLNTSDTIYKLCDVSLCSSSCRKIRLDLINDIDPQFSNPESWGFVKNYRDVAIFQKNYPLQFKKSTTLSRKKSYSLININLTTDNPKKKLYHRSKILIYIFTSSITLGSICASILILT